MYFTWIRIEALFTFEFDNSALCTIMPPMPPPVAVNSQAVVSVVFDRLLRKGTAFVERRSDSFNWNRFIIDGAAEVADDDDDGI